MSLGARRAKNGELIDPVNLYWCGTMDAWLCYLILDSISAKHKKNLLTLDIFTVVLVDYKMR